jgi:hypothetical protein
MESFADADWAKIDAVRAAIAAPRATVVEAAELFAETITKSFSSVVLARMFLVVPASILPKADRAFAARLAGTKSVIDRTRILSLVGTYGRQTLWCERTKSEGHFAIPLFDAAYVQNIPMIAKLLADLEVDFASLDEGRPIATRRMLGGRNGTFYVHDAANAKDAQDRFIIPSRNFVDSHTVRTVFGMGGAYYDGTLAVSVIFTSELIERAVVDRFSSLISNFKIATTPLIQQGRIYT